MKTKLRIVSILMAVFMLAAAMTACAGEPDNSDLAAADVYGDLVSKVTFPEMFALDSDGLLSLVGIESSLYSEAVAYIPLTAVSGNMVFIIKTVDGASAETVAQKLENYRSGALAQMNNYLPAEYDKISASSVETDGSFVWLVVADDQAAAVDAVSSYLNK
ncbi:MAG: DUF4358 domain-containing protein [Clostridia bacterium]|nr:DUF4358 domain-containing protein [Clostridia bacterium]